MERPKKVVPEPLQVKEQLQSAFNDHEVQLMIKESINEREQIIAGIMNIFPNIKDSIYINNFAKMLQSDKQFVYVEDFETNLTGEPLLTSLILNASQQFCFWVDSVDQTKRHLSSSDFHDVTLGTAMEITNKSITLRKERNEIIKELWSLNYEHGFDNIRKVLGANAFNNDFFKKKKNLLKMFFYRFNLERRKEYIDSINPAIDYQIPKMLRAFDIIEYPSELESKIRAGKIIPKDSTEEIFIRSVSYMALVMIQEKYGFDQVKLDWWLWSNRHNETVQKYKHHCTITEDY